MAAFISSTPSIDGRLIAAYLQPLFAKGSSFEAVLQDMQQQADALSADAVVSFFVDFTPPKRFTAQGTAVRLAQ